MQRVSSVVWSGFLVFFLASCGPKPGQDISVVIEEQSRMAAGGKVDEALSNLARYEGSQSYHQDQGVILQAMIRILCQAESQAGRPQDIPAQFAGCLARMSPGGALKLAEGFEGALIKAKRWETAEGVLAKLETILPDTPERQAVIMNARVDLRVARDGHRQGAAYLSGLLTSARDEVVARNLGVVGQAALAAGDAAAAEPLYQAALNVAPERVLTREEAARGWLRAAAARKSFPDLMARLEHIQKLPGFPPEFVLSLLDQHYLLMLEQADAVLTTRLYAFCETLRGGKLPADERQFLGGIMLDMSFLQGDFQKALSLVESGAVDFKEDLKRKMVAKIHAHIEMKKGNPREAIRYLREFMGYVAQTEQEEFDPINHVRVSREMILGLNAKRIGDLLVSAGEAGEAGKAFTEARDYYSKALTKYPDENSLENRKIRREMAAIPAP